MSRKLEDLHQKALLEFDDIQAALQDEREQCLEDRRFYSIAGAQWEGDLSDQFENKPKFEVNKIHLSVIRIVNEYLNNPITVNFVSKDGSDSDDFAEICNGRYRADEQDSCAEEAYDNCFEESASGGIGAWRLIADYEDEDDDDNDHQRIYFEPIYDADKCVFFDLGAKRQDKSDAKKCWVLHAMPIDQYIEEFDDDPASWPQSIDKTEFDWETPDIVYIAEYYQIEMVPHTIEIWKDVNEQEERYDSEEFKDDPDLFTMLTATGWRKADEKKVKKKKVHKYIMSGNSILRDEGFVPGKCIPVIINYGKRWFVDNVERCMGHVRLAKDAQRLKNMQLSKLGEISALSPIEKPIFAPEQVAGHEAMWADDNIKNYPYLLSNPMMDAEGNVSVSGPVAYTKPPQIPPAMSALLQVTEQDMADLLGNQQAAEEIQPNISGKAVELIQNKLDMQTYIYLANMRKAIKRCGEVWLSMAKEIYVEDNRKIKTLSKNGESEATEINMPVINPETGEKEYKNDFAKANYDVSVEVGPSTSTKRAATVKALTGMMQMTSDPETQLILSSLALMNTEGEGLSDVKDYFRQKLLRMGAVKPTEAEAQQLAQEAQAAANRPPDPQSQYLQAAAQEAAAKAQKAQADTMLTAAKTEETKAKTVETLAGVDQKDREQTINTIQKLTDIQEKSAMPQQVQGNEAPQAPTSIPMPQPQ